MYQLTLITLGLIASVALVPPALSQCNQNCTERRTIYASVTAEVVSNADFAVVRVGYKLYGPDARSAYASSLETSNAIMHALTESGIPSTSIESTSQVLQHTQPFEFNGVPISVEEQVRRLFTVTQSWTIHVKPEEASSTLNTAINAGANESGWIQWVVNDPGLLEAKASAEALANAHEIAEQIAQKSGVHLGHLVNASQNPGPMAFQAGAGGVGAGMGSAVAVGALNGGSPLASQQLAINSRRIVFQSFVTATYEIEDPGSAR